MHFLDPPMNLPYLIPRIVRRFLPPGVTRFLLMRSLVIRPGLETSDPRAAVDHYVQVLKSRGRTVSQRQVMVFGYGGRFDIGLQLLEAGAASVVLCDKFALPDDHHNQTLVPEYSEYLAEVNGRTLPRSARLKLVRGGVEEAGSLGSPMDLVVSTSVFEHLQNVEETTKSLAALTARDGMHIHFIDLRDHFFKYPFEMLHYSESTWRLWLNPTSNHNRYRLWDYRRVFEACFAEVEVRILERDEPGFERARNRIRPEFKRGNLQEDAVTLICVIANKPRIGQAT